MNNAPEFGPDELVLPDGTRYEGRPQYDDDGAMLIEVAKCGTCGFMWNDALITSVTPVPAGRCPNEYGHTAARLEYLREQLRRECISMGELVELQGLAEHIDPSDVELLEAAGVPEHKDEA